MSTPGTRPDQGLVMLDGEECAFSAVSPVSSRTSYLSVQLTDLTAQAPLAELEDSIAPTFRFDALEGHAVEVELGGKSEVFPSLTHRFTVDTRCRVLDDKTYYLPTGYKVVERLDVVGASVDEEVRMLHDARTGHLYVHHAQGGWVALTSSVEPAPAQLIGLELPAAFAQASASATLHFLAPARPGEQEFFSTLVDGADAFSLRVTQGGVEQLAQHSVEGSAVEVHTAQRSTWLRDEGGTIWLLLQDGQRAFAAAEAKSLVGLSSALGFVLDTRGDIARVTHPESSPQLKLEPLGSITDAQKIVPSGGSGELLLVLRSDSSTCATFEEPCTAELRRSEDLTPLLDAQSNPYLFDDVIAAQTITGGILALRQTDTQVEVIRITSAGDVTVTRHDELRGSPDPERSIALPDGFALGMRQRLSIVRFGEEQVIGDEGRYQPRLDALGRLALVAEPCEDIASCKRILWQFGDFSASRLHTSLRLGPGLDLEVTQEGELDQVVLMRGERRADVAQGASVRLAARVPFGAPCLPAIVSTVATDRFSSTQEGLFCLGWHDLNRD